MLLLSAFCGVAELIPTGGLISSGCASAGGVVLDLQGCFEWFMSTGIHVTNHKSLVCDDETRASDFLDWNPMESTSRGHNQNVIGAPQS